MRCLICLAAIGGKRRKFCSILCKQKWHNAARGPDRKLTRKKYSRAGQWTRLDKIPDEEKWWFNKDAKYKPTKGE